MARSDADWSLLEQIPALPPPPGVQSDFQHPRSREALGKIVVGLTYGLMVIFLALRIYARYTAINSLGVDDYLSLAAGASITGFTGISISLFGNPLGPHQWDVPLARFNENFLGRTLSSLVLFALSSIFVRTALLSLYLRVFAPNRAARMMIWVGITVIVVFYTLSIVLNIRFCVPLSMTTPVPNPVEWANKLKASSCSQPVYNLNAAVGLFGVLSDIYVLMIPVSMVYKLRIPRSRKFGILGIFLTGLLAVSLSGLSTVFRFLQLDSYDFTWDSIPSYTLRAAELNIGLICSCMPVVFVVLRRFFKPSSRDAEKRGAMPRTRTPSHAYISDLRGTGYRLDVAEDQTVRPPTKPTFVEVKGSTQTGERSTDADVGWIEPHDEENVRDSG
ncbi:hypothetical protein F5Y03DRAFT_326887 [Xylaria venustula]|nr:hypothetical protein F5Y03DRAFT_326887 [Xylaria venustula]